MRHLRKIVKQKILKTSLVIGAFLIIFFVTFTINRLYIKKNTDLINVVVAVHKVPAFSQIALKDLALAQRPRSVVPAEAVTDLGNLSGPTKYYAGDLGFGEGDIIRQDRLFQNDNNPRNLALLGDQNKMLVAVDTNLVKSTANLVVPGTLVNAVVFIKGDLNAVPDRILSPAEDPKLGNLLVVDKKNSEAAIPAEKGRDAIPSVITVMLDKGSLDVAKALVEYNEKGSIYLLPIGFRGDIYLAAQAGI